MPVVITSTGRRQRKVKGYEGKRRESRTGEVHRCGDDSQRERKRQEAKRTDPHVPDKPAINTKVLTRDHVKTVGGRGREGWRGREREREGRKTDSQTDTERQTGRQADRDRQTDRKTDGETDRDKNRQTGRQRQTDR